MRAFNQGAFYRVTVSAEEVSAFMDRWPCSGLSRNHGVSFTFEKASGDLVDIYHPCAEDGGALVALSHDAQEYGRKRLKLENTR